MSPERLDEITNKLRLLALDWECGGSSDGEPGRRQRRRNHRPAELRALADEIDQSTGRTKRQHNIRKRERRAAREAAQA